MTYTEAVDVVLQVLLSAQLFIKGVYAYITLGPAHIDKVVDDHSAQIRSSFSQHTEKSVCIKGQA